MRNWERALLALLALAILTFFGCLQTPQVETEPAKFKYNIIVIENSRLLPDEEFKEQVEVFVRKIKCSHVKVHYDEAVRLHRTYLIRAWVLVPKTEDN